MPERKQNSHKGTFGKVLNIAGSEYMTGAAYLSSVSALKIGCGYCFLASKDEVIRAVSAQTQNIVFTPIEDLINQIKTADVVSIGCGLSTDKTAQKIFNQTIKEIQEKPLVIDADGLNILTKTEYNLSEKTVLTPHPKEASRLLNVPTEDILKDTEKYAKEISKKYGCTTVLKLHETIVCSKDLKTYKNTTGNSSLAKAGSGDVLTGFISGLLAQGMEEFEASCLAVYLHGKCAELASADLTEYSVSAKDLIEYLPKAIKLML